MRTPRLLTGLVLALGLIISTPALASSTDVPEAGGSLMQQVLSFLGMAPADRGEIERPASRLAPRSAITHASAAEEDGDGDGPPAIDLLPWTIDPGG